MQIQTIQKAWIDLCVNRNLSISKGGKPKPRAGKCPPPPKENLGLVAIECLFGCAESSILNYLMHSLANVNACLTLCYSLACSESRLMTWHNQESTQRHRLFSPWEGGAWAWDYIFWCSCSIMARTWRGIAESLDGGLKLPSCQLNPYWLVHLHRLFSGWHHCISSFCHHLCSALPHCVGTTHHWTGNTVAI